MSFARIALALGAAEGADEATVLSAIDRLKQSSHRRDALLTELRATTQTTSDAAVLGAVRGLMMGGYGLRLTLEELKGWLGHSEIRVTQRYAQLDRRCSMIGSPSSTASRPPSTPRMTTTDGC